MQTERFHLCLRQLFWLLRLNIPHGIKNYGADSYPVAQGFVPENVIPGIVIQIY